MRVLAVFAFPRHRAQNEKPLRKPHHTLLIFLGAQLKICSTCLHTKFSSLQDFEILYTLVWNSHWIINTRLQCKCLKTMQELEMRSVSSSLVCTLGKVTSEELQTASSCYIQQGHLENSTAEGDAPAMKQQKALAEPRRSPGPGWAPE